MAVSGVRELKARLKAVRTTWKPAAKHWQDETIDAMRPRVPERTGKTRRSIKAGRVTTRRASVRGSYVLNFLDAGTKAHDIRPKKASVLAWSRGGRTIFAKRVHQPAVRGHHFKAAAARTGWEKADISGQVVKLWNEAA